jgi:hypothetical protein
MLPRQEYHYIVHQASSATAFVVQLQGVPLQPAHGTADACLRLRYCK